MIANHLKIRTLRKADVKIFSKMMKAMAAQFGDKAKINERDILCYCFGNKKISEVLIAFAANRPAGFAITYDWINFYLGIKIRHIGFLFVRRECRRGGIASALMQAVAHNALKAQCECLSLDVRKNNKMAIELYKKLGFKKRKADTAHYRLYKLQNSGLAQIIGNKP